MLPSIPFIFPGLKPPDYAQVRGLGKPKQDLLNELRILHEGVRPLKLIRPCAAGDGVRRLSPVRKTQLQNAFEHHVHDREITVFIAASGAASRMFSGFQMPPSGRGRASYFRTLYSILLSSLGDLGSRPKALCPFHFYPDGHRTALEEQIVEAAMYARSGRSATIHVSVTPEHSGEVSAHLLSAACRFSSQSRPFSLAVTTQDHTTDTIALDLNGAPLRDGKGHLVMRPAGHGALLSNLENTQGDIVYVRTIDNVLPDRLKPLVVQTKRILGGLLLDVEQKTHKALAELASGNINEPRLQSIETFARKTSSIPLPGDLQDLHPAARSAALFKALNRPLRVCGVIPNTGLPGGAPFWVEGPGNTEWLRIVERHETAPDGGPQEELWRSAAYFNSVDIVCSLRDFEGRPFDLALYADSGSWFVFERKLNGRLARVLERPGLWNGSMAYWNTILVEVPRRTAAPVKRLADLMHPMHRV